MDIVEKTSDRIAQEEIAKFAKTGKAGRRHTGKWKNENKEKYLSLSPIEYLRSDEFDPDSFISRADWFLDQYSKDKRNDFRKYFRWLENSVIKIEQNKFEIHKANTTSRKEINSGICSRLGSISIQNS